MQRRKFSHEFKLEVVRLMKDRGVSSTADVCRKHGEQCDVLQVETNEPHDQARYLKANVGAFVTAHNFAKHPKALHWRTPYQLIC